MKLAKFFSKYRILHDGSSFAPYYIERRTLLFFWVYENGFHCTLQDAEAKIRRLTRKDIVVKYV